MVTRTSSTEPGTLRPAAASPSEPGKSVIGNDLRIVGQGLKIVSQGVLQVDGEIEGDVQAAEITVSEDGKVTGMVAGKQVVIGGKVSGVVCGKTVALQSSSDVEGDIHHMSFTVEQGATFEGRSRRAASEAELDAVTDAKAEAAA